MGFEVFGLAHVFCKNRLLKQNIHNSSHNGYIMNIYVICIFFQYHLLNMCVSDSLLNTERTDVRGTCAATAFKGLTTLLEETDEEGNNCTLTKD